MKHLFQGLNGADAPKTVYHLSHCHAMIYKLQPLMKKT